MVSQPWLRSSLSWWEVAATVSPRTWDTSQTHNSPSASASNIFSRVTLQSSLYSSASCGSNCSSFARSALIRVTFSWSKQVTLQTGLVIILVVGIGSNYHLNGCDNDKLRAMDVSR